MPCTRPLKGYRTPAGKIVFRKPGIDSTHVRVSCGQCMSCRLRKSADWAIRSVHESRCHDKNSFLTLTFADEHYPEDGSVHKEVMSAFVRRMRRRGKLLRYFACGEYGGLTGRAHYHALIFGENFSEDRKCIRPRSLEKGALFASPSLESFWPYGLSSIGEVEFDSAAYVARYTTKKITGSSADSHYGGRNPEFASMSLKPGIGATWFKENYRDIYPEDFVVQKGKKYRPPVYYDRLLESTDKDLWDYVKQMRKEKGEELDDLYTDKMLKAEEVNVEAGQSIGPAARKV